MYKRRMVPEGFAVPGRVEGAGLHLRMLSVHDVIKDLAAVVDAAPRLVGLMEPGGTWPEGITLEENLTDLGWHEREFTLGHSFAYTVMNDDESRCLGCCYIYPSDRASHDAMAFYWARDPAFDAGLGAAFREFVAEWPFRAVAFPGRDIPWADW